MTDENITLCPGCGTELYDAADVDGLCEDCQPDPEEDDADNYCTNCSGSGEGMYDGTRCYVCNGSGVERQEKDEL
jgi:hypothetical protein